MITYTLSREEFLSFQQKARSAVTYASIIAIVVPPLVAVLAFLTLFDSILSTEDLLPVTGCWLLSIFLTIGVFSEFVFSLERRRNGTVEESRDHYEQYHSSASTFDFDDVKWMIISRSSRVEDSWVNLKAVTEWLTVVTVFAKGHVLFVIPKRVFSSEDLDQLRKIVFKAKVIWPSYLNTLDFIVTETSSRWRSHPYTATAAHLLGIYCIAIVGKDLYHSTAAGDYRRWFIVGLFLLFTLTAEVWYLLAIYIGSLSEWRKRWVFGVAETGVYMKTSRTESFTSWDYFKRCRDTMQCYLLYINASQYYVWPKRDIPNEHRVQVHQLLEQHLMRKGERNP